MSLSKSNKELSRKLYQIIILSLQSKNFYENKNNFNHFDLLTKQFYS